MSSYHSPRRTDAAASTRRMILDTALALFLARGYTATTVPEIAAAAGVAVPTVYTSTGGKAAILAEILKPSVEDPSVEETLLAIAATDDPRAVVDATARGTREDHERHWEVVFGLFQLARAEPVASAVLDSAIDAYLAVLGQVADRLIALDALLPGLDRKLAVDLLWLHLGQRAWFALVGDRGWSFEQAQRRLARDARNALLREPGDQALPERPAVGGTP